MKVISNTRFSSVQKVVFFSVLILLLLLILEWSKLTIGIGIIRLFHDDSFFYGVIARNFANGLGFSFDGIEQTNGFHPLWVLVLSLLHKIIPLVGFNGVYAIAGTYILFNLCASSIYAVILYQEGVALKKVTIFFLCFFSVCGLADLGQESSLYGLCLAWLIYLLWPYLWQESSKGQKITSSKICFIMLAVFLTIASRLDSVVIIGFFILSLLLIKNHIIATALLFSMLISLLFFALFNYIEFGHFSTISSYIKSGFSIKNVAQLLKVGLSIRVGISLILLICSIYFNKPKSVYRKNIVVIFCGYLIYYALIFTYIDGIGSWYINVLFGLSIFIFFFSLNLSNENIKICSTIFVSMCTILLLFGSLLVYRKIYIDTDRMSQIEMGTFLTKFKVDKRFFQVDGSGIVSYFSERKLVNGDGLVNNFRYQEFLKERRFCEYVRNMKIDYFVSNRSPNADGIITEAIFVPSSKEVLSLFSVHKDKAIYETQQTGGVYRIFNDSDVLLHCSLPL